MKNSLHLLFVVLTMILFNIWVDAQETSVYSFEKKIALAGNSGYDYLYVDSVNHHLFVSHGTSVNVIDLTTEQPIASSDNMKGVHGTAGTRDIIPDSFAVLVYKPVN
jgi:hypothetical protein